MELKDKRLMNKSYTVNQDKYLEGLNDLIPDAVDKYEEVETIHEPINLLNKIKSRRAQKAKAVNTPLELSVESE